MPNWYTITTTMRTHTMKPSDPLLLADGTKSLFCLLNLLIFIKNTFKAYLLNALVFDEALQSMTLHSSVVPLH